MSPAPRIGSRPGAALLVLLLLSWLLALGWGYDPVLDVDPASASLGPSLDHPLGTDRLGRDVLRRLLAATRSLVGPGLLAGLATLVLAVPAGLAAGYRGGQAARVVRAPFSVVGAVPRFVLVLLVAGILGDAPTILATTAGLAYAPALATTLEEQVGRYRVSGWIEASRVHGLPLSRILWDLLWRGSGRLLGRHLLRLFAFFLGLETTLSYIGGFGVEEPVPSWGNMLAFAFGHGRENPLAWLSPAVALWLTAAALALCADRLAEPHHG